MPGSFENQIADPNSNQDVQRISLGIVHSPDTPGRDPSTPTGQSESNDEADSDAAVSSRCALPKQSEASKVRKYSVHSCHI